jgi:hypothetical protein
MPMPVLMGGGGKAKSKGKAGGGAARLGLLVLAAASNATSNSSSLERSFLVQENYMVVLTTDFSITADSWRTCVEACSQNITCNMFTWHDGASPKHKNKCYFSKGVQFFGNFDDYTVSGCDPDPARHVLGCFTGAARTGVLPSAAESG